MRPIMGSCQRGGGEGGNPGLGSDGMWGGGGDK